MNLVRTIEVPEFITHIKVSERRRAKYKPSGEIANPRAVGTPRYEKINSQKIYSGNMTPMLRQKVVKSMKLFLADHVMKETPLTNFPVVIRGEAHVPENYGDVRASKGEIHFPLLLDTYIANWDIDNLGYLWCKCFNDCLVEYSILPDDNIRYVKGSGEMMYMGVDDFDKRKLVFNIFEL